MISVITITFNNFEELVSTCNSITESSAEHIVINGGSCLKTKEFLNNKKNCISLSEPDNGIADAFTKGVKLASRKYVCFINSGDILIDRDYFSNIEKYLNEEYDIVCCDNIHETEGLGKIYKKSALKLPNMPYNHQGLVVKKDLIESTNFFDDSYKIAMDFNSIVKITKLCSNIKVFYYKKAVVLMDGNGISHSKNYLGELEKFRSLRENNMLSCRFALQLGFQYLKAQTKRFLICIGLAKIVNLYKSVTNKRI